jgi:hypothetical protein
MPMVQSSGQPWPLTRNSKLGLSLLSLMPMVQSSGQPWPLTRNSKLETRNLGVVQPPGQGSRQPLSGPQFYEDIANPRLTSKEAVLQKIKTVEPLLHELERRQPPSTGKPDPELTQSISLLKRFLDFAGETNDRQITLVGSQVSVSVPNAMDQRTKQRAVAIVGQAYEAMLRKWTSEIRPPPPPGFFFVKIYERREEMARDYDLGPEVAGVAFPCRFIAIALPYPEGQGRRSFIEEEFEQTMAHEFVHSFCHSSAGFQKAHHLPRWFQEGFALYLSGERRLTTAIERAGGTTIRDIGSTEEYQQFKGLFQFIREKYGEEKLYRFATASLQGDPVDQALADVLHLSGQTGLMAEAAEWSREKQASQVRSLVTVLCLALAALWVMKGRWAGLRWVAVSLILWMALVHASSTPYYIHTSLWWVPVGLAVPLLYLAFRFGRGPEAWTPVRLVVEPDWPHPDEIMESWPYEEVDLAEILEAGYDAGEWYGEKEFTGPEVKWLMRFLDAQPTSVFYFQGGAYRVWYERPDVGEDEEA